MRRTIFTLGLVVAATPAAAESLCAAGESVWFDARAKGGETRISVCGAPKVNDQVAWLQFREGVPGTVKFAWPEERAGSMRKFTLRRYTRPRTTYLKFHFQIDGIDHAILEGHEADFDPPTSVSYRVMRVADETVLSETDLEPTTEELSLMGLEYHVRSAEFDE